MQDVRMYAVFTTYACVKASLGLLQIMDSDWQKQNAT